MVPPQSVDLCELFEGRVRDARNVCIEGHSERRVVEDQRRPCIDAGDDGLLEDRANLKGHLALVDVELLGKGDRLPADNRRLEGHADVAQVHVDVEDTSADLGADGETLLQRARLLAVLGRRLLLNMDRIGRGLEERQERQGQPPAGGSGDAGLTELAGADGVESEGLGIEFLFDNKT